MDSLTVQTAGARNDMHLAMLHCLLGPSAWPRVPDLLRAASPMMCLYIGMAPADIYIEVRRESRTAPKCALCIGITCYTPGMLAPYADPLGRFCCIEISWYRATPLSPGPEFG